MKAAAMARAIVTDVHFVIPFVVLCLGLALLVSIS
jgi:hypothetical protein